MSLINNAFTSFFSLLSSLFSFFFSYRRICGDDNLFSSEKENRLFCHSDVFTLHHDRHPFPSLVLAQPGVGSGAYRLRWVFLRHLVTLKFTWQLVKVEMVSIPHPVSPDTRGVNQYRKGKSGIMPSVMFCSFGRRKRLYLFLSFYFWIGKIQYLIFFFFFKSQWLFWCCLFWRVSSTHRK